MSNQEVAGLLLLLLYWLLLLLCPLLRWQTVRATNEVTGARVDGGCVHIYWTPGRQRRAPCTTWSARGLQALTLSAPKSIGQHFWRIEQRLAVKESASAGLKM